MIKVFCDSCKREIPDGDMLSSNYQRRVQLSQLNVCFNLEFQTDEKPKHVCLLCAAQHLENAVRKLREPSGLREE